MLSAFVLSLEQPMVCHSVHSVHPIHPVHLQYTPLTPPWSLPTPGCPPRHHHAHSLDSALTSRPRSFSSSLRDSDTPPRIRRADATPGSRLPSPDSPISCTWKPADLLPPGKSCTASNCRTMHLNHFSLSEAAQPPQSWPWTIYGRSLRTGRCPRTASPTPAAAAP